MNHLLLDLWPKTFSIASAEDLFMWFFLMFIIELYATFIYFINHLWLEEFARINMSFMRCSKPSDQKFYSFNFWSFSLAKDPGNHQNLSMQWAQASSNTNLHVKFNVDWRFQGCEIIEMNAFMVTYLYYHNVKMILAALSIELFFCNDMTEINMHSLMTSILSHLSKVWTLISYYVVYDPAMVLLQLLHFLTDSLLTTCQWVFNCYAAKSTFKH